MILTKAHKLTGKTKKGIVFEIAEFIQLSISKISKITSALPFININNHKSRMLYFTVLYLPRTVSPSHPNIGSSADPIITADVTAIKYQNDGKLRLLK